MEHSGLGNDVPSETRAIIVAAGRGSRMGGLTDERPKCMLEFEGKPLIKWQRAALGAAGIEDITIVSGYLAERIEIDGASRVENPAWQSTNMVYSLMCAEDVFLSGKPILVAYSDIVYEARLIDELLKAKSEVATVVDLGWHDIWRLRFDDPLDDAETLKLAPDDTITEIGLKPKSMSEIEGQYVGLTRFSPRGARDFAAVFRNIGTYVPGKSLENCYFTDVLNAMIGQGRRIQAAFVRHGWLEFDAARDIDVYKSLRADDALEAFWSPERAYRN